MSHKCKTSYIRFQIFLMTDDVAASLGFVCCCFSARNQNCEKMERLSDFCAQLPAPKKVEKLQSRGGGGSVFFSVHIFHVQLFSSDDENKRNKFIK